MGFWSKKKTAVIGSPLLNVSGPISLKCVSAQQELIWDKVLWLLGVATQLCCVAIQPESQSRMSQVFWQINMLVSCLNKRLT